jgi:hypothetical protein
VKGKRKLSKEKIRNNEKNYTLQLLNTSEDHRARKTQREERSNQMLGPHVSRKNYILQELASQNVIGIKRIKREIKLTEKTKKPEYTS